MANDVIDVETLRRLLALDPETGALTWLPRPREMFTTDSSCGCWNGRFAGMPAFQTKDDRGYHCGVVMYRRLRAHRVVWALCYGEWPRYAIDHINGDTSDNRPNNLRDVGPLENNRNRPTPRNNTTGAHGVSRIRENGKWRATINVKGKQVHLGCFVTISSAVAARKAAELKYGFHENHGRKS